MLPGVVLSITLLIAAVTVDGCHPRSRKLHVCLNMYLEKDFSDLETLIFPPKTRLILPIIEDNQMQEICNQSMAFASCYATLFPECDTGWQLDRYSRLLVLLNDTIYHVCKERAQNLKELLYKSDCVISSKACRDFNWLDAWKSILRLNAEPSGFCPAMYRHRTCLQRPPVAECGAKASELVSLWLQSWCGEGRDSLSHLFLPVNLWTPSGLAYNWTWDSPIPPYNEKHVSAL